MNNTQPENNQPPSWFANTVPPINPTPSPSSPAKKKMLLLAAGILAFIVLSGGGLAFYITSVQNAKQSAVLDFTEKYIDFYSALSSIDDRLEPEGVDPVDIALRWQTYKDSITSLKKSPLYPDNKSSIDAIESISSTYTSFVVRTIPQIATYITDCTYNDAAGTPAISKACLAALETIIEAPDSPANQIAKRLLTILSDANNRNLMTEADIANAYSMEERMFAIPTDFALSIEPELAKLNTAAGINQSEE